jgi:hypothetical protein
MEDVLATVSGGNGARDIISLSSLSLQSPRLLLKGGRFHQGNGQKINEPSTGSLQACTNKIKSNTIYFNCACATIICLNQNKQNGSHNTPLRELGRDQFSPLHFLRPRIRIKYKYLIVLATMLR